MPFDPSFKDVYNLGIRAACEAAGAYCERVDEQIFQESILQRIYNQISKADVIVADMSGRNPNVFYETGYAHALGKTVILLTRDADDIPFDLKHYPHIVYGGSISSLRLEVERRVRWSLETKSVLQSSAPEQLQFYIGKDRIVEGEEFEVRTSHESGWRPLFRLQIGVHNASDRVYDGKIDKLGIIVPKGVSLHDIGEEADEVPPTWAMLPNGTVLHSWGPVEQLLPGGWESLHLFVSAEHEWQNEPIPFVLRLFTGYGPRDLKFQVRPVDQK